MKKPASDQMKKGAKLVAKLLLTGLAIYFVFTNIDWGQVSGHLLNANLLYLLFATFFFIGSKVVSAYRLQLFFQAIDLKISDRYNLKLAWMGMFYNLFLPGGIGGDGYKVYLLNKQFGTKVKLLIQATLLDRISGLVSLLILVGVGILVLNEGEIPKWVKLADMVSLLLVIPVFYLGCRVMFKFFRSVALKSLLWSVGVQFLQVISAVLILASIGVSKNLVAYSVLFLISSFVSILPFTIGGLGSREFTFLIGFQYFGIEESYSIALSLLFTLITALVSFGGIFMKVQNEG
ncbi:MAG: lysylphosphatidylglycerol synthase transmembrane domain-containing protein [Bacteroidota bacterium]